VDKNSSCLSAAFQLSAFQRDFSNSAASSPTNHGAKSELDDDSNLADLKKKV